jgi:Rad3-related DNA helicase
VICKVPFPNLGDKQISARLHSKGGNLWYRVQAVRSIVQMSGRGMRHEDDYCETYILDSQFVSNLWKQSKQLFPNWWVEALRWNEGRLI